MQWVDINLAMFNRVCYIGQGPANDTGVAETMP